MSKQTSSKKPVVVEPVEVELEGDKPEARGAVDEGQAPAINRSVRKEVTKLTVTLKDGSERVYSYFTHGKNWETLATNYAKSQDGTIE